MQRRRFLALATLAPAAFVRAAGDGAHAQIVPGRALSFPRDHGSHPQSRIEWWYVTGHLDAAGERLGFQVTFFRARRATQASGRFAPAQILFAHAALADPRERQLLHAEAAARAGFVDAFAREDDTALRLGPWRMDRDAATGTYRVALPTQGAAQSFSFELVLSPQQPLLLQGEHGFSQKGPSIAQASYYYSQPQLEVSGAVTRRGKTQPVQGRAWLDHEWSETLLDPRAAGWDWIGLNLDDGAALMAFRIRERDDAARTLWAAATLRERGGAAHTFAPHDVHFSPRRWWTSARTNARYPVACSVQVGDASYDVEPVMDDQELDSRGSTGLVYWEGAVLARRNGNIVGRGYLELTGYAEALRLEK